MLIAGAGNLGLHTLDQLLADKDHNEIIFFDKTGSLPGIINNKYLVISNFRDLEKYFQTCNNDFIVTLGNSRLRERLTKEIIDIGGCIATIVSKKSAFVSAFSIIESGSIIQPGCAISHNVKIGYSCIIHASSLIGHDVEIDKFVTIGSMVNILKGVKIGSYSTIGPNVLIYQNVKIGNNVYIESGSIVKNDVGDYETIGFA